MQPFELSVAIKQEAQRLGFDWALVTPVAAAPHADFYDAWIQIGRADEMHYLERNLDRRRYPALLAEGETLRSIIVLATNYRQFALPDHIRHDPSRGIVASYAWGDDYHEIIKPLLFEIDAFVARHSGRTSRGKCLVDTGPVLERDWAARAGLGFFGKNCCTIRPGAGSWLFLATVIVPEILAYDSAPSFDGPELTLDDVLVGLPPAADYGHWRLSGERSAIANPEAANVETRIPIPIGADFEATDSLIGTCGRCTRCLDACPTGAFVGPFHLDPERCISYWTIESRSPIPRGLRGKIGNRIFGCDICQEVCPWNARMAPCTPLLAGLKAQQERVAPFLLDGFAPDFPDRLKQEAFNRRFRRSPIRRAKRRGMLRNVCVALGNWGEPVVVDALSLALADPEPLVRIHAASALGEVLRRHGHEQAKRVLSTTNDREPVENVRIEIRQALNGER